MADPAFATARQVDELTDVPLDGLPMTSVDRVEDALLSERPLLNPEPLSSCTCGDTCGGWRYR